MAVALDSANRLSFVQTYRRLFPDDDPLSQANRVGIPGQLSSQAAPAGLLHLARPGTHLQMVNGLRLHLQRLYLAR